jgi:hypothetical protein
MVSVALVSPVITGRGKTPIEWILLASWALLGIILAKYASTGAQSVDLSASGKASIDQ